MQKGHTIKSVDPGSIADELGLEPGDRLLSIDGHELEDIFDYEYYIENESIMVVIAKKNGEEWELEIEKEYEDDLGIEFENGLMDVLDREGVGCITFSSLEQGLLTNKYLKGVKPGTRAASNRGNGALEAAVDLALALAPGDAAARVAARLPEQVAGETGGLFDRRVGGGTLSLGVAVARVDAGDAAAQRFIHVQRLGLARDAAVGADARHRRNARHPVGSRRVLEARSRRGASPRSAPRRPAP